VMVQDLLSLEATCKELVGQLGRTPTDVEWMQAAGADTGFPDLQAALTTFQGRLHAGRNAKQVRKGGCGFGWVWQATCARRGLASTGCVMNSCKSVHCKSCEWCAP
jgi:hypothetical protein